MPILACSGDGGSRVRRSRHRGSAWIVILVSMVALSMASACSRERVGAPSAEASVQADPGASFNLPLVTWAGGPAYYASFAKAVASGWTAPSFFPIAVFQGKPQDAASLKSIGINTYMGAEHDGSSMASITATGMSVLAQQEWTDAEVGDDPRVVGWNISDECEMGYSECGEKEADQLAKQEEYASMARARDDGRFLQANFGNGVLGTFWSPNTMAEHVSLVDVTSVDKYAYTSPHVRGLIVASPHWPSGKSPDSAQAYGWLQDRMETFSSPPGSKPNWVFVETAMPYLTEAGASVIRPYEIEGAVWSSIIHGAAGIAYFQHSNDSTCGNYSLMTCEAARNAVSEVNGQVQALAPVLNTQSFDWTFGAGLSTSLKAKDGYAYVFAMTDGGSGSRTFSLPTGVRADSVEVVDENRSIAVSNGGFTDTFDRESSHHIYRFVI